MKELIYLIALWGAIAGVLATLSIWSPRKLGVKLIALTLAVLALPAAYASFTELLSRPKPLHLEWDQRALAGATVLSAQLQEGEHIYLWLALPDLEQPRAYALPWNEELAKQLHRAQQQAEREGSNVRMRQPFENSLDPDEPLFYAPPQPPPPAKSEPQQKPLIFKSTAHNKSGS
jgi:hypothetical protein